MKSKVNIKVSPDVHSQIVKISEETGINIYKLAEMGLMKVIDEYETGTFEVLIKQRAKLRRDGTLVRT